MTANTIQELLNSGAYILEDPQTGLLNIGRLTEHDSDNGSFVDYETTHKVNISEPDYQLSRAEASLILNDLNGADGAIYTNLKWSESSLLDYELAFSKAQESFKAGELKKVILYRDSTTVLENGYKTFIGLLKSFFKHQKDKKGYFYALSDPKKNHFILGLAPEYLFKKNDEAELETVAVAGTGGLNDNLLADEKILNEHRLVEEGIAKALDAEVKWSKVEEVIHVNLKHLSSKGTLVKTEDSSNLANRLHPTAAIGFLPKTAILKFKPGPSPRGFYGGYSELKFKDTHFSLVLIRGLEIKENMLKLSFGGGVIPESDMNAELGELDLKLKNLKNIWNL